MSTFEVTVERLTVKEHPNADSLELAEVGGYHAVIPKGVYETGDLAVYIPEQAIVPDELLDELGLAGKLAGKNRNRVKAIRLRGELSQGIVCRPKIFSEFEESWYVNAYVSRTDVSDVLGIEKWVPYVPIHMSGEVIPDPDMLRWIDIEDIKKYPDMFAYGEHVVVTEKIHGTCCIVNYNLLTKRLSVSSKGLNAKKLSLKEDESNLYWRTIRKYSLDDIIEDMSINMYDQLRAYRRDEEVEQIAFFGEIFGAGIQDLDYGRNKSESSFNLFDVAIKKKNSNQFFLDFLDLQYIITTYQIAQVPILAIMSYNKQDIIKIANEKESIYADSIREGAVVKTRNERTNQFTRSRTIAKFISEAYLTRKGGTEYE